MFAKTLEILNEKSEKKRFIYILPVRSEKNSMENKSVKIFDDYFKSNHKFLKILIF